MMERDDIVHVHGHFAHIPTTIAAFASRVCRGSGQLPPPLLGHFGTVDQAGLARKIGGAQFVATCTGFNVGDSGVLSRSRPREDGPVSIITASISPPTVPSAHHEEAHIIAGGRLVEQKGLRYLIAAAVLLRDRLPSFRIEIVGDGEQFHELTESINHHQLAGLVALVGSMPHDRLRERMRNASMVAVMPCVESPDGLMDGIPDVLNRKPRARRSVVALRCRESPARRRPRNRVARGVERYRRPGRGDRDPAPRSRAGARAGTERAHARWRRCLILNAMSPNWSPGSTPSSPLTSRSTPSAEKSIGTISGGFQKIRYAMCPRLAWHSTGADEAQVGHRRLCQAARLRMQYLAMKVGRPTDPIRGG